MSDSLQRSTSPQRVSAVHSGLPSAHHINHLVELYVGTCSEAPIRRAFGALGENVAPQRGATTASPAARETLMEPINRPSSTQTNLISSRRAQFARNIVTPYLNMVLVYLLELVAKSLSLLRSAKIAEKNGRFHGALCHISP